MKLIIKDIERDKIQFIPYHSNVPIPRVGETVIWRYGIQTVKKINYDFECNKVTIITQIR